MKTFAAIVERQLRQTYWRLFAEVVAIRSPPLIFRDKGGNLSAEISEETAVIAVNFSQKRRYPQFFSPTVFFCTKHRRCRVFFPPIPRYRRKISNQDVIKRPNFCRKPNKKMATTFWASHLRFCFVAASDFGRSEAEIGWSLKTRHH